MAQQNSNTSLNLLNVSVMDAYAHSRTGAINRSANSAHSTVKCHGALRHGLECQHLKQPPNPCHRQVQHRKHSENRCRQVPSSLLVRCASLVARPVVARVGGTFRHVYHPRGFRSPRALRAGFTSAALTSIAEVALASRSAAASDRGNRCLVNRGLLTNEGEVTSGTRSFFAAVVVQLSFARRNDQSIAVLTQHALRALGKTSSFLPSLV